MTCVHREADDGRGVASAQRDCYWCWLESRVVGWAEARERAGVPHPRVTPAVVAEPVEYPREPLRFSVISEDEAPFIHHARGDWRHSNVRSA